MIPGDEWKLTELGGRPSPEDIKKYVQNKTRLLVQFEGCWGPVTVGLLEERCNGEVVRWIHGAVNPSPFAPSDNWARRDQFLVLDILPDLPAPPQPDQPERFPKNAGNTKR